MEDLLILIIKWIVQAIESRSEKSSIQFAAKAPAVPTPAPPVRPRKRALRAKPVAPTAVAVPTVVRRADLTPEVVVAPVQVAAVSRSLMGALRSRQELVDAMILTELLGAPASLRDIGPGSI